MRPILREIRAVAGVTGVAVIIKQDGQVERVFPAAFTERHTEELLKLVTTAYQRLRGFNRLSLRFERVVVHLLNEPEFLLFATVLPDSDERLFESVVQSKLSPITRELTRRNESVRISRAASRKAETQSDHAINILVQACNALAHVIGDKVSLNSAAKAWRDAREVVSAEYEALCALEVDAGGRLSVRKGRFLAPSADNMRALAEMVHEFFKILGTSGANAENVFYTLLDPHREALEESGFFHFMREAASPAGRNRATRRNSA